MYSETNRRASARRANDEFLRRMMGGELGEFDPRLAKSAASLLEPVSEGRVGCDGTVRGDGDSTIGESCPLYVKTPSLAMVYAPRQCWQNLLDPEAALANGTLFGDLILPFEGGQKFKGTEGHSVR